MAGLISLPVRPHVLRTCLKAPTIKNSASSFELGYFLQLYDDSFWKHRKIRTKIWLFCKNTFHGKGTPSASRSASEQFVMSAV